MTYLISIAIGPVQDFINTARRSRDLWFGSWLLSELAKTAALAILESGGTLIFPDAKRDDLEEDRFSAVNKIVALVNDPKGVASNIRTAMEKRLETLRLQAYGEIPETLLKQKKAEAQVTDLIEFYWAAAPCDDPRDGKKYCEARNKAEALLAARKATRNFKATDNWAEHAPKSSLDGQRESVITESVYDDVRDGKKSEEWLRHTFGVRPGERLCGVGLLKRRGKRGGDDSFFSTSHVAALPLLSTMSDKETARKATNEYIEQLKKLGVNNRDLNKVPLSPSGKAYPAAFQRNDGHLLFEERLRDYFSDKQDPEKAKANFEQAKKFLQKFLEEALDDQKPEPYYALLLADGDRMGQAIDAQKIMKAHRDLSAALSAFAAQVRHIVEDKHHGSLVYAGGDDVLAFLPLHTVLLCAYQLNQEFGKQLRQFSFDEEGKGLSPTLSVGIVVAHHLDPLSDALGLVREAEKTAKAVPGKNALAVTISKRSGVDLTVKGCWGEIDRHLDWFVILHRDEALPDGAAYELRNLALRLKTKKSDENHETLQRAAGYEALRILRRKRGQQGERKISEEVFGRLEKYLQPQPPAEDNNTVARIEALANELIAARVFAKATWQAGIEITELKRRLENKESGKEIG